MKKIIRFAAFVLPPPLSMQSPAISSEKKTIGPTAVVLVKEGGIRFEAFVDTGAGTTSINAQKDSANKWKRVIHDYKPVRSASAPVVQDYQAGRGKKCRVE